MARLSPELGHIMIEHDLLPQVVHEIASCLQESRRETDYYHYIEDRDGDLFSPSAKCKIKNVIYRNNYIGEVEGQAFDEINRWFNKNRQGAVAWISPMHPVYYPLDSKIIISEINNYHGIKTLINRSIILDMDGQECLEMAQVLAERSINRPYLESVHAVRTTPLFLNPDNWVDIMSEIIYDPELWDKVRSGQDITKQAKALQQAQKVYRGEVVMTVGSLSCPVNFGLSTGFRTFFDSSLMLENTFPCPKCERGIPSGKGITTCPHCGARKEDYKKCD